MSIWLPSGIKAMETATAYANVFKSKLLYSALIFLSISIVTVLSVNNGSFYDDEIFNISSVPANDVVSLWHLVNAKDVHPPGSYLINKLLFTMLGRWEYVKIFGGILNGFGLTVFALLAFSRISAAMRLPLVILLATSGTFVMWGASVRWYAYFNPIFTIALALILFSSISFTKRTLILGLSVTLLFYISYAAFCAAPVLLVIHILRERENIKRSDIVTVFAVGFVSFILCAPQLITFIQVQLLTQVGQTGSFVSAIAQLAITLLVGNAVFPIATLPTIYAAAIIALMIYFLLFKLKTKLDWIALTALTIGALAMAASGIGVKPRNSVFLLPLMYLIVSSSIATLPKTLSRAAIAFITLFQIMGIVNAAQHRGTLKGSYDTNYSLAIKTITSWNKQCRGNLILFHYDVVFAYMLDALSIKNSSPFNGHENMQLDLDQGDCVVFVKTYHGGFDRGTIASYMQTMNASQLESREVQQFSKDPNAAAKAWIAKEPFPQYLIELYRYDVSSKVSLPAWNFALLGS
jgi:hypothetical protein